MTQPFRVEHIMRPAQAIAVHLLCIAWEEYWSLPTIKRKKRSSREELAAVEGVVLLYVPTLASAIDYQTKLRSAITTENIKSAKAHIESLSTMAVEQIRQLEKKRR